MPARSSACSSRPTYCCGDRSAIAIRSKGTPAPRFVQNPARDLDRLAAFARRGEEFHLVDRIAVRRRRRREQIAADASEAARRCQV
jgi:hypothetical protein